MWNIFLVQIPIKRISNHCIISETSFEFIDKHFAISNHFLKSKLQAKRQAYCYIMQNSLHLNMKDINYQMH